MGEWGGEKKSAKRLPPIARNHSEHSPLCECPYSFFPFLFFFLSFFFLSRRTYAGAIGISIRRSMARFGKNVRIKLLDAYTAARGN